MAILELKDITFGYEKKIVLENVNFKIENGVIALLGVNGAGKTTLINLINGLYKAKEGSIVFNDKKIEEYGNAYYNYVGYMPQMPRLYGDFSAEFFMKYMAELKNVKDKGKIDELLELVNLTNEKKKKIKSFSGGMRQRLGIAQALLNEPDLLILDEPTAGLDPAERIRFRNIISKIANSRIVIYATHIVSDVECIAKELLMVSEGHILKSSPSELIKKVNRKVFTICIDDIDKIKEIQEKYIIANLREYLDGDSNKTKYEVKVVSDSMKDKEYKEILPSLEDAFMIFTLKPEWFR